MSKHALLVGINNYSSSQFNLRGCVNDIDSLARLLCRNYSYVAENIEFLKDNNGTRVNILARLENMLSNARAGDVLVLGYSGHGTQIPSTDPAEPDLKDECIVPYEASYASLIKDKELYALLNRYINPEIKMTCIYDCCHSGTLWRELGLDENGKIIEKVLNRYLPIANLIGRAFKTRDSIIGPYNVLAACHDEETAADLSEAGPDRLPRGAFSYALHAFLQQNRDAPITQADSQILGSIRSLTPHPQNPSYVVIDVNSPLIRY